MTIPEQEAADINTLITYILDGLGAAPETEHTARQAARRLARSARTRLHHGITPAEVTTRWAPPPTSKNTTPGDQTATSLLHHLQRLADHATATGTATDDSPFASALHMPDHIQTFRRHLYRLHLVLTTWESA